MRLQDRTPTQQAIIIKQANEEIAAENKREDEALKAKWAAYNARVFSTEY
jgi:hypothetical protein